MANGKLSTVLTRLFAQAAFRGELTHRLGEALKTGEQPAFEKSLEVVFGVTPFNDLAAKKGSKGASVLGYSHVEVKKLFNQTDEVHKLIKTLKLGRGMDYRSVFTAEFNEPISSVRLKFEPTPYGIFVGVPTRQFIEVFSDVPYAHLDSDQTSGVAKRLGFEDSVKKLYIFVPQGYSADAFFENAQFAAALSNPLVVAKERKFDGDVGELSKPVQEIESNLLRIVHAQTLAFGYSTQRSIVNQINRDAGEGYTSLDDYFGAVVEAHLAQHSSSGLTFGDIENSGVGEYLAQIKTFLGVIEKALSGFYGKIPRKTLGLSMMGETNISGVVDSQRNLTLNRPRFLDYAQNMIEITNAEWVGQHFESPSSVTKPLYDPKFIF